VWDFDAVIFVFPRYNLNSKDNLALQLANSFCHMTLGCVYILIRFTSRRSKPELWR